MPPMRCRVDSTDGDRTVNAEQHAQAILNAIQAAEAAGFMVEIVLGGPGDDYLTVADHFKLVQPFDEGDPWDMDAKS